MSAYTDADMQAAAKALAQSRWEGFVAAQRHQPIDSANERYAEAVLDAVASAIAARALREFATNRVTHQTPARLIEDMFDRADEIEADQ